VKSGPGNARLIVLWQRPGDLAEAQRIAGDLLRFMDGHLAAAPFLAADHATIADLACYSYVAHAPEGRISLEPYAAVRAWLGRVETLPGFVPMPPSTIPEGAAR
jgi:glutathione S-transferase